MGSAIIIAKLFQPHVGVPEAPEGLRQPPAARTPTPECIVLARFYRAFFPEILLENDVC